MTKTPAGFLVKGNWGAMPRSQDTNLFALSEMALILCPSSSLPLEQNSLIFPVPADPGWCWVCMIPKNCKASKQLTGTQGMGPSQCVNRKLRQAAVYTLTTRWRRKEQMDGKGLKAIFSSWGPFPSALRGADRPTCGSFFCKTSPYLYLISDITWIPWRYLKLIMT